MSFEFYEYTIDLADMTRQTMGFVGRWVTNLRIVENMKIFNSNGIDGYAI